MINSTEYINSLFLKAKEKSIPLSGTFELTTRCNFNCKMCYIHTSNCAELKEKELTTEQWKKIADEAQKSGTFFLLLTGGEPLLRNDFDELYIYCKKLGFEISVNTNASLIDDKKIELFKTYPPVRINISLYGPDEETYYAVTGTSGSYDKCVSNILKLKEAGIAIKLSLTISSFNSNKIADLIGFAKENDITLQYCNYIFPPSRVTKEFIRPTAVEAAKNMVKSDRCYFKKEEYIRRFKGIENFKFDVPQYESECGDKMRCRGGSASFWVTYDGNMIPCGMLPTPKSNIVENGFINSWQYVNENTKSIRLPAKCSNCNYLPICDICAASCYAEIKGFLNPPEYLCEKSAYYVKFSKEELQNVKNQ